MGSLIVKGKERGFITYDEIIKTFPTLTSTSIPVVDESKLVDHVVTIAVQVAGKLRGTIEIPKDSDEDTALEMAKSTEWGQKYIVGDIKKIVFVKNKILNIVI